MKVISRVPNTIWGLQPSYLGTDKLQLGGTDIQPISIFNTSLFSKIKMAGLKEVGDTEKQTQGNALGWSEAFGDLFYWWIPGGLSVRSLVLGKMKVSICRKVFFFYLLIIETSSTGDLFPGNML